MHDKVIFNFWQMSYYEYHITTFPAQRIQKIICLKIPELNVFFFQPISDLKSFWSVSKDL